jgi:hypothetical protein
VTQLLPDAYGTTLQNAGTLAAFDLASGDNETAFAQVSSGFAISQGDQLRLSGIILHATGAPTIFHNTTIAAELTGEGAFSVDYEAAHGSPIFRIVAGATTDPATRVIGLWRVEKLN